VALIVGGFFVPYIAVVQRVGDVFRSVPYLLAQPEGQAFLLTFIASVVVGLLLHVAAAKLVEGLED